MKIDQMCSICTEQFQGPVIDVSNNKCPRCLEKENKKLKKEIVDLRDKF